MSWINTAGKDFRPAAPPQFSARIDDPASFVPPKWKIRAGDNAGMPDAAQQAAGTVGAAQDGPAQPGLCHAFCARAHKSWSITTYDPDDFIRIESQGAVRPAATSPAPEAQGRVIRGYPVFAES